MSDSEQEQIAEIGVQKQKPEQIDAIVAKHKAKAEKKEQARLDKAIEKKQERKNSVDSSSKQKQSADQEEGKEVAVCDG